ncbi:MAG: hypothetical protein ACRDT2_00110 [Natronosporangium sp.]
MEGELRSDATGEEDVTTIGLILDLEIEVLRVPIPDDHQQVRV